jgi:hypothetical protein
MGCEVVGHGFVKMYSIFKKKKISYNHREEVDDVGHKNNEHTYQVPVPVPYMK